MRSNRFLAGCLSLTSGFVATTAYAEPSAADKELAKQLYQQATIDMQHEAYDRACPQFAAALQLDPNHVRTAISLGTCEERWGKFLSALLRFEHARTLAVTQSAAEKIVEIDGLIVDLKHRVPHLRVIIPERIATISELTVIRNGAILPASEYGKTVPVDPGTYEVMASSPVSGVWKAQIKLEAGKTAEVTVGADPTPTYTANEDVPGFNALGESSGAGGGNTRGVRRGLGFTGIGLGAAGFVAGGVTGVLAISKNSASDDGHCDAGNYCDTTGTALRRDAQQYAAASTGLFIVGGVLLATGIVLVATAPSAKTKTSLWIGPSGFGLRGQW